jgi:hypothetical protein
MATILCSCGSTTPTNGGDATTGNEYTTLSQLAKESSFAAIGTAGDSHIETVSSASFTVTDVSVRSSTDPDSAPSVLEVRQTGTSSDADIDMLSPVMVRGKTYLFYTEPFVFSDGKNTGEYIVTGEALWGESGTGQFAMVTPGTSLPQAVTTVTDPSGRLTISPSTDGSSG